MKIAVDISPVSESNSSFHKVRGVGSYINLLRDNLELYDKINTYVFFKDRNKIPTDVKLIHYPYFELFFQSLPLISSFPFVVTIHDVIPIKFPKHFPPGLKGKLQLSLQRFKLSQAKGVITDSLSSKKDIHELLKVPSDKIHTIYLAADESYKKISDEKKLNNIRKKNNIPKEFALYVGDATWNKNLPRLINAIKKAKVPLVMVGKAIVEKVEDTKNTWNKDLITVQNETLDRQLFIKLGFIPTEDLAVLYNLAAFCIMPSLYEGFGLPVLEAMQSGCPVITSKNSSLKEIGGDAVLYVDPNSIENLSGALNKMIKDERLRKELSEKGLLQAKRFSIEHTIKQTISVYQECL